MRYFYLTVVCFIYSLLFTPNLTYAQDFDVEQFRSTSNSLIDAAVASESSFERLTYLVDYFPARISGSKNLEDAIDWIVKEMKNDGFDSVYTQDVMVPHWVRGNEAVVMNSPIKKELPMLGLGGSIGTPLEGITAEVMVVKNFEDLKARADEAKGKIVLFNLPFQGYGNTVFIRTQGANEASKAGAVASIIRSVSDYSIQTPHTGVMRYEEGIKKIPHAAITLEDADLIERFTRRGETVQITLRMEAKTLDDAPSRNIIAEIKGSEFLDEVIVMGGHIDSWDVGQGAMDDGGGSVAAWEALRIIKDLDIKPKRTIRVVLWTNEENGSRGALAYRDSVDSDIRNHVLAIESDAGVFRPLGFGFGGNDQAYTVMSKLSSLLSPIDADEMRRGGSGADIGPLMRDGVPGMGLIVEPSKYFWYHHTHGDTIDKLDKNEFNRCIAALAVITYSVADLPFRLPFGMK